MRTTTALGFLVAAFAAVYGGSARATVTRATVPDDFPTVQEALDALQKGDATLCIRSGVHQGPVMATGFTNLRINAELGATIVASGSEPALTICSSNTVTVYQLGIESQSVGLFVNNVAKVTADHVDIVAGSHGVLAESTMTIAELQAMFPIVHDYGGPPITPTMTFDLGDSIVSSSHGDAVRVGPNEVAAIGATTLVAPEGDGIHAEGAGVVRVSRVTIDGAGDDGVDVSGKTLEMSLDNVITRPADDGVTLGAGAQATILGIVIRNCGDSGVVTHDGGSIVNIAGARISNTVGDGIRADAGRIGGCTVTDAAGNGIVSESDRCRLDWNTVTRTGGDGIQAAGDGLIVVNNDVTSAAGDGLRVSGDQVVVTDNSVVQTGDNGIRVEGEGAYVSHNEVNYPVGNGILVSQGWSEVVGDVVTGAGGDGICVLGAPDRKGAAIGENVIDRAAGDGIDVDAASGARLAGNKIAACGQCGIRLGDGAIRNRLTGNSAEGSGSYDLYESDESRKNRIARSNRFRTHRHRGAK